jgi:lipopolysaccharide transport system permease protein
MFRERIGKINVYRNTLWSMSVAQLKSKYSASILGISWAIINPLLVVSAITFVFVVVFKIQIKNFSLFALAGIFPWMFCSMALSEATISLLNQQHILRQFNLPREIIPLSSVLSNFLNFLLGWLVIYPIFLVFNHNILILMPLLFVVFILNLVFISGLALVFSVLNVFARDISQLLSVILMLWFWVTPIFYSIEMVPLNFRWLCTFNPLTPFVVCYREVVFLGNIPSLVVILQVFLWSFLSIALGFWFFYSCESKILKRL